MSDHFEVEADGEDGHVWLGCLLCRAADKWPRYTPQTLAWWWTKTETVPGKLPGDAPTVQAVYGVTLGDLMRAASEHLAEHHPEVSGV